MANSMIWADTSARATSDVGEVWTLFNEGNYLILATRITEFSDKDY